MWSTPGTRHMHRLHQPERRAGCGSRVGRSRSATTIARVPVGREVEVVGIRRPGSAGRGRPVTRVDRRQRVALVVGHVEPPRSYDGTTCCGSSADRELPDHPPRGRVDHIHGVAPGVGHVDQRARPARGARQHVGAVVGVDVDLMRRCGRGAVAERARHGRSCLPPRPPADVAARSCAPPDRRAVSVPASAPRSPLRS